MRRSSRLILLLGIFLAVGAFILILFLNAGGRPGPSATPATGSIVVAAVDIEQGATITASMVTTESRPLPVPTDSISLAEQVIGKVARQSVAAGAYVPQSAITGTVAETVDVAKELQPGERAVALRVAEDTGVGTLIQPGDRVDVLVGLKNIPLGFTFPLDPNQKITSDVPKAATAPVGPAGDTGFQVIGCTGQAAGALNCTSVKLVIQNVRVVATLVSALPTAPPGATPAPTQQPVLTGRAELVIIAVTAQQAELLSFVQTLEDNDKTINLALRSPADATASPDLTTGIVLRTLIDQYGVLPPRLIVVPNKGQ